MYQKPQSNEVWFLRYGARQIEFFVILGHFLPFDPPNNLENQNFEKNKKTSGDVIILRLCIKNHNHTMCGSWDIRHDRIFCHFRPFFALWPAQQPKKSKFCKNENKAWRYYHFTLVYHKWQSYDVWSLRYGVWQTWYFLSFWANFCLFTPLTTWKKILEISEISYIEVGNPPKKTFCWLIFLCWQNMKLYWRLHCNLIIYWKSFENLCNFICIYRNISRPFQRLVYWFGWPFKKFTSVVFQNMLK